MMTIDPPGIGGPATHYWTHSTKAGGCVFEIANGLEKGLSSHYLLRYVPFEEVSAAALGDLDVSSMNSSAPNIEKVEKFFIQTLNPEWNRRT